MGLLTVRTRFSLAANLTDQTTNAMDDRMDNGTMEVATSLGAVGGGAAAGTLLGSVAGPAVGVVGALVGAVAGGLVGRRVGRALVGPPKARNPGLMEVLDVTRPVDARPKGK
jgi:phage tail tape-measure protein